ncbi:HlyD family type I secretion periplasmic adaptor subunit [Quisquiliibacterium transsilvanicum]
MNQMNTAGTAAQLQSAKAGETLADPQRLLQRYADTGGVVRMGLGVLALAVGGFVLWAALAPLDEGVPTPATVAIDTKRKAVQHLSGGIVKEVLVREGDQVDQGQALVRLDEAVSRANFEAVRQRYFGLSAMHSRLLAEQVSAAGIAFRDDVLRAAREDSYLAQQLDTQRQFFRTRRQGLEAELQSVRESVEGQRAQREAARQMMTQRQRQQSLLQEELDKLRGLVAEGYAPRNRQLELERQMADLHAAQADLRGTIERATRTIAELEQRVLARRADFRKEVGAQLADVAREVQADAEKYTAVSNELRRVDIVAPAAGQVVGLAVQTVGAVVQPGQKLMDIVPREQELLLEAQIAPHLIDKVAPGLPADIRFSAFTHSPQLVVEGRVVSVSGDLLADPANPQFSYFLARLRVTPEGMRALGGRQMQPGMPAEVIIRTGERSMLTYLLGPLTRRIAASMKEE